MNAYNDFRGFADPVESVVAHNRRSPFAAIRRHGRREMHNGRGLVIAVLLSLACWALIGLALVL